MNRTEEIIDILNEFIEPSCELIFHNNFELVIAVMLSAQTTDKSVNIVTPALFSKYKTPIDLMNADIKELEEIIKPIGLYKNKSKNAIALAKALVEKHNSIVPNTFEELVALPGVGRKTANVVLALGFNIPAIPVDTHVFRVAKRLKIASSDMNELETEKALERKLPKSKWIDAHHLLLLFGRYYCKAINPKCENCLLKKYCKL